MVSNTLIQIKPFRLQANGPHRAAPKVLWGHSWGFPEDLPALGAFQETLES